MMIKLIPGGHEVRPEDSGDFSMSPALYKRLQIIKYLQETKWDALLIVDGPRRAGKSTVAQQMARVLDPTFNLSHIIYGLGDAKDKLSTLPDGSAIVFDESSLMFNSKESMRSFQINFLKWLDVAGQKRFILILCLPTVFDLTRSIIEKVRFLIHVYTDAKLNRGHAVYFGEKRLRTLYALGKPLRSYNKPAAEFPFNFPDYQVLGEEYEDYLKLKRDSLLEAEAALVGGKDKPADPKIAKKVVTDQIVDFFAYMKARGKIPPTQLAADYLDLHISGLNTKIARKIGQNNTKGALNSNKAQSAEETTPTYVVEDDKELKEEAEDGTERNT